MPIIRTHQSVFKSTTSTVNAAERWDHIKARLGIKRAWHRVDPGLYVLGIPTPNSHVFVTGNYTLSFDALRSALKNHNAYILVLDTFGVNVWCAAGKGTFSTRELIHRMRDVRLGEKVAHRRLILPQLGAAGVSAHEVKKITGFVVEYGPIRADDLPEYLKAHTASPGMRTAHFHLRDRLLLIPVEVKNNFWPMVGLALTGSLLGGWAMAAAAVTSMLAATVLFPIFLPTIPFRAFSLKGFLLGTLAMLPFIFNQITSADGITLFNSLKGLSYFMIFPAITAYVALNFTGCTPFTSKTGVQYEMKRFIPLLAWICGTGTVFALGVRIIDLLGVA